MPPDIKVALEQAAARPRRIPDLAPVLRRGYRERRRRAALMALSVVAAVALPVGAAVGGVSIDSLFGQRVPAPAASPEEKRPVCPETPFDLTAYFVRHADRADMRRATSALQRIPGVAGIERVGRREAFNELKKIYSGDDLPQHAFPGWVYVAATDHRYVDRLARRIRLLKEVSKVVVVDAQQQRIRCRLRGEGAGSLEGL